MNEIKIFNSEQSKVIANIHSDGEMINLTDLWKEAGSPKNKELKDWLRKDTTDTFVNTVCKILKVEKTHLLKIKRGRHGGIQDTMFVTESGIQLAQRKIAPSTSMSQKSNN